METEAIDGRHGWAQAAENRRREAVTRALCVDEVNGMIFGGETRSVLLVSPNGKIQCRGHIDYEESPKAWGEAAKAKLMSERTGDGRTMSDWPDVCESIYGKGAWEVRVF